MRAGDDARGIRLVNDGTRIVPLLASQRYADASVALWRLGVDGDGWPVPPAGLFVIEERTMYVRSLSPLTIARVSHAIDCALGGGVYYSGTNSRLRRAFVDARAYVTPYAASGLDEYVACYVE